MNDRDQILIRVLAGVITLLNADRGAGALVTAVSLSLWAKGVCSLGSDDRRKDWASLADMIAEMADTDTTWDKDVRLHENVDNQNNTRLRQFRDFFRPT